MTIEQFEKASEIMQTVNDCHLEASEFKSLIFHKMEYKGDTSKARFKLDSLQDVLINYINLHFEELEKKGLEELKKI